MVATKTTLWQRGENAKDNEKFFAELKKKGMKINTLSEANLAEFRKIALQIYPDAIKGFGEMGKVLTDLCIWANK